MPAYFESGVLGGGERAWHGMGHVLEEDVFTVEKAAELAPEWGSDVVMVPTYVKDPVTGEFREIHLGDDSAEDGSQRVPQLAAMRMYDGKVVGNGLTDQYRPRSVVEKFNFLNALTGGQGGEKRAMLHTCGTLKGGSVNWMMARLDGDLQIAGDNVARFLFCSDSYNGSSATLVAFTNVRIVCSNTLQMAVNGAPRYFKARHTGELSDKLEDAATALELAEAYNAAYYEQANRLVKRRMSKAAVQAFLDQLIPLPVPTGDTEMKQNDRAARNAEERQSAIRAILEHEDLANVKGTAWGVYNAVAEYDDWYRPTRNGAAFGTADENRFERAVIDPKGASLKGKALEILLAA